MRDRLNAAMKTAMKDKDQVRLATLRLINAAIKDRDIAARGSDDNSVSDAEIMALLGKMIKQREESATLYENGGRLELAGREREEMEIIREFLPEPLDQDATEKAIADAIEETGASSLKDMGAVMGILKSKYVGRLDFGSVGKKVKDTLAAKS